MANVPVQVTYRETRPGPRVEQLIERRVEKLARLSDRIVGVQVLVEVPHRHQQKGRQYHVRVAVELPGAEVVASRQPPEDHRQVSMARAVGVAFDKAQRELTHFVEERRQRATARVQPQWESAFVA
ncbi:MAG: ribosome-associated translation inhibitor RaiA [Proteobacteria bacterium]|nr:ribosome-associated translation inhibitor RaiA [Pseudomonadota bacterium]